MNLHFINDVPIHINPDMNSEVLAHSYNYFASAMNLWRRSFMHFHRRIISWMNNLALYKHQRCEPNRGEEIQVRQQCLDMAIVQKISASNDWPMTNMRFCGLFNHFLQKLGRFIGRDRSSSSGTEALPWWGRAWPFSMKNSVSIIRLQIWFSDLGRPWLPHKRRGQLCRPEKKRTNAGGQRSIY